MLPTSSTISTKSFFFSFVIFKGLQYILKIRSTNPLVKYSKSIKIISLKYFFVILESSSLCFHLMMTKKDTLYSSEVFNKCPKFNKYFLSKLLPIKSWNSSWFVYLVISLFCKQYECFTVFKSFLLIWTINIKKLLLRSV